MESQAKLQMSGQIFDVLDFRYTKSRGIDQTGRPGSDVFGSTITLTVKSIKQGKLFSAIIYKEKNLKGTITVKEGDGEQTLKEYSFEEGYMVDYEETFDSRGQALTERFTITANKFSADGVTHDSKWATQ